jgi:4-amino-4-deoxy-L-arabinose transferase-like glycosyltransferase
MQKALQATRVQWVLILLGGLLLGLYAQRARSLWGPDEGRYVTVAERMLASGDWVTPRRNDTHLHVTKPPFTYWATALSMQLFGHTQFAARLPQAIAFALTLVLLFALGLHFVPGRPWLPSLIYATTFLPFVASNLVTADNLLTFFETLAMLGFVRWWAAANKADAALWRLLMWIAFGFAFLTKGPPGLLPLLGIFVFTRLVKRSGERSRIFSVAAVLAFLLIALPWFVALTLRNPDLLEFFLRDETYNRIFTDYHDRNAQWYGPVVVYGPVLLLGLLPWNLLLWRDGAAFGQFFKRLTSYTFRQLQQEQLLLACWILLPFAVFVFARSRLPLYLLPLIVPFALLVGRALENVAWPRWFMPCLILWIASLIGFKFYAAHFPYHKDGKAMAVQLLRSVTKAPREVVFIEEAANYSLGFYLRTNILHVAMQEADDDSFDGLLIDSLAVADQTRVYVVNRKIQTSIFAQAKQLGLNLREIGSFGPYVFAVNPNAAP